MKKIGLFLGPQTHGGGKFQYNLSMLEAVASLPMNNYEVIIAYINDDWLSYLKDYELFTIHPNGDFSGRAFCKALRMINLPMRYYRSICSYFHPVVKPFVNQKCDLWIFPSEDVWAYHTPVPTLVTIFDLMHRYEPRFPEVSANGEYEWREKNYRNICKWAKGVLVDSEVGKKQVEESYGLNPEKIYILPYIPPKYIYFSKGADSINADSIKSRYLLPEKFIFYPAQFWEHKNHKSLIEASHYLKNRIPDLKLVFVGSEKNSYRSSRALVEQLRLDDDIYFLGYIPDADIPEFYRRARAMIMPTFFGPTNIPPLEAMALECPVAVSDIYGMRAQLGDAALYFNPSSIKEIAQTIDLLWEDDGLCKELSKRGLVRASQWNQSHFNELLRNIIADALG